MALVSDAGTPLVSDPGYRLAQQAIELGHRVVPIPGPSAPLAALVGSGQPSDAFLFAGFLPVKEKGTARPVSGTFKIPSTLIFFESPHRIADTLVIAADVLGPSRSACVCRELTKTFEEFKRGTLGELAELYGDGRTVKGEIVLVIGPPAFDDIPAAIDVDVMLRELAASMPATKAAAEAARLTGLSRKDLYQRLIDLKAEDGAKE